MKITRIKLRDLETCDKIAQIVDLTQSDKTMRLWCLPSRLFGRWLDVENVVGTNQFVIRDIVYNCTWFVPLYFVENLLYDE